MRRNAKCNLCRDANALIPAMTAYLSLIGVIAGSVITFVATSYKDAVQWRRSELARLGEMRRKAYADYAAAVKLETTTCRHVVSARISIEEGFALMAQHQKERTAFFENVLLVGSPETVSAAREWQSAVSSFRKAIRKSERRPTADYKELYRVAGVGRDKFYVAARKDLQVGGDVSSSTPDVLAPVEVQLDGTDGN
jgi:hypothetical protein